MNERIVMSSKSCWLNAWRLRPGKLLVVADGPKQTLGELLQKAGRELGAESVLMVMEERSRSGEEPPAAVAAAMEAAQAVVCVTEHSLTHTNARKRAAAAGARVATMPGITEDMFLNGAVTADYLQVKELTEQLTARLTQARHVRVEKAGRALEFSIENRDGVPSTGMFVEPGQSGNLPSGEAYIAPVEGSAVGAAGWRTVPWPVTAFLPPRFC
ncbi:hypothetical protein HMSSN036_86130 [Paenibacillus macerans]|nr:hypothetical protein HMSSN036_86130 [Paenibacillus macerans]